MPLIPSGRDRSPPDRHPMAGHPDPAGTPARVLRGGPFPRAHRTRSTGRSSPPLDFERRRASGAYSSFVQLAKRRLTGSGPDPIGIRRTPDFPARSPVPTVAEEVRIMLEREHRRALQRARSLSFPRVQVPPPPCEHHTALQAERRELVGMLQEHHRVLERVREALVGTLQEHHRVLERVREAIEQDRTYYRRALEENRWLVELAERILQRMESRKAA